MNLDQVQVLYGKLMEFIQKTFGHHLVPFGLGFDFTMLNLNLLHNTV